MTSREQKMVLFLPAAGVLAVYGLFPFRYHLTQVNQATAQAAAAQTKAPAPSDVQLMQARLRAVEDEINKDGQDLKAIDERWQSAAGKIAGGPSRPMRIQRLNALLAQNGLNVVESRDAEGTADGKASPALETLTRELAELAENQQPRRRFVRFRGTYAEAFTALQQISRGDVLAVPLGLSMRTMKGATPDTPWREWTLQVWV